MRHPRTAAILLALLFFPACSHDTSEPKDARRAARSAPAPPSGKLETIERRQYPAPSLKDAPDAAAASSAKEGENEVIRIEGESAGSPGLVLSRAMSGAQALGFTLLELEDRDLFFVAEKRASLLGTVLGGTAGICKIVVGAAKDPASDSVKVTLKGRARTATGRVACERDLAKLLEYARGEAVVKPKKPSTFSQPADVFRHGP